MQHNAHKCLWTNISQSTSFRRSTTLVFLQNMIKPRAQRLVQLLYLRTLIRPIKHGPMLEELTMIRTQQGKTFTSSPVNMRHNCFSRASPKTQQLTTPVPEAIPTGMEVCLALAWTLVPAHLRLQLRLLRALQQQRGAKRPRRMPQLCGSLGLR